MTGSISFIEDSLQSYKGTQVESDEELAWVTIVTFECRGLEPVEFYPGTSFIAHSAASETVFGSVDAGIDLSGADWADYDETGDESVCIYQLES